MRTANCEGEAGYVVCFSDVGFASGCASPRLISKIQAEAAWQLYRVETTAGWWGPGPSACMKALSRSGAYPAFVPSP